MENECSRSYVDFDTSGSLLHPMYGIRMAKKLRVSVPVYLNSGPSMNKSESPLMIHIDLGQHETSKGCILQKFAD